MCRLFLRFAEHPKSERSLDLKIVAEYLGKLARLMRIARRQQQIHFLFLFSCFPDSSSDEQRAPQTLSFRSDRAEVAGHLGRAANFSRAQSRRKNFDPAKPKFYVLDMFPYPSGAGLHVGHPEGYTATDIVARYKRMRGFNVLHPMGWDAFGLPAEQYAIKTGQHPAITTRENIAKFKSQLKRIGFSYDWQREVNTTDPRYFKWTQWIFLQIYNSWFNPKTNKAEPISTYRGNDPDSVRLAYVAEVPVNWCPELGTVLANEEVVDGKSEVGGFPGRAAADAAMDAAHHRLRRALDRRTRRSRLAGIDQIASAKLDRPKRRRGDSISAGV